MIHYCEQYSWEWWVLRGVPTASEFNRIVTPVKGTFASQAEGYCHQLIADLYDPNYGKMDNNTTVHMQAGTEREPESRRLYEFQNNLEVQQVGFVVSECGRFGCSPDSLVGEDGVLELKNPLPKTQVKYLVDGVLPVEYRPQCHGHLLVTGREFCDFVSYSPPLKWFTVRVTRDAYTESLAKALEEFWSMLQEMKAKVAA